MNYWIFQANLEHDLRKYLREGKDDTWLVSRYWQQMSEGDLIFFWLGGAPKIRGIYGWGTIAAAPKLGSDQGYSVKVRYHKRLNNHLPAQQLQKSSGLKELLIFRQPIGTNFMLSREQTQAIADLMLPEERPHVPPVPQELIDSIHAGDCVLFAGAGLSARAGVPTWDQFLSGLLTLARENQIVDPTGADSFAAALKEGERNAVADGLVHAFGDEREKFHQFLLKTFPAQQGISSAHELIRRIPFFAVLTTNYDALLEKAFPQYAEAGLYTPQDAEALLDALSQKRRFILKLYGFLQRPETLILAPIEYQEAVSSNVSFSKFVEGLFFSRTFFFLGLSLEGIQDFLSGFVFRGTIPRRHYALMAVSGTAWKAKADLLERRFNVRVIDYPVSKTYPEFETFLETLSRSVSPSLSVHEKSAGISGSNPGIRRIVLEDIGSFDRLELDFAKDQWKILLGDNGVGKSTVLKAIAAAIIGSDARSYAGRLVRAGKTRGRITIFTERNPHGYITDILTKDMLSDSEVISVPSRYMEAEGALALGFSPLRSVTWSASSGPQPIIQKGRPTADDLIPLLAGDADPRMDRLKQWIVNLDAADRSHQLNLRGHQARVSSLIFAPDGRTLISGSIDKTVRLWDAWTGQEMRKLVAHSGGVNAVAVSRDGTVIISGSFDQTLVCWDARDGRILRKFEGSLSQILAVSMSTSALVAVSGSEGGSIRLWDISTDKQSGRISDQSGSVWSVAISEDASIVIGAYEDGSIRVYDVSTGHELQRLTPSGHPVWSIALAADGRTLASGTENGSVIVWDIASGKRVHVLQSKGAGILSVAISDDGKIVAAGSQDGSVTVWDAGSSRELLSQQTQSGEVWSVALSSDGRTVAAGSDDKTIRLWSVPIGNASTQYQTIKRLFEVIAGLTDRKDIEYLRVTENFRVMVKVAEAPAGVPLELLSQGLTSLLGWVGYLCQRLRETAQDSSSDSLPTSGYALVLIDEIDAHMHPRWQQVMVQRLKQIFPNVQFIASTHSPLIAGGLEASEVVRFERDSSGFVRVTTPEHSLKGIGAAGLLTSDMFGLASHLDSETAEALDRKRQLTAKRLDPGLQPPEKTAIETELHQLEDLVKSVDTTKFIRDPLYLQFVEAMSRVQPASPEESIVLTPKERQQKAELAEQILRDLMKKEKKPAKK